MNVFETSHLTKKYGKDKVVLDDVSLCVREGDIYGLVGRNGAGKTTLIRILLGLANQTSGEVRINGANTPDALAYERRKIGSIVDSPALSTHLTALENMKSMGYALGATNEEKLKDIVRSNLENLYDDKWLERGLPLNVFKSLKSQADNDAYIKAQEGNTDEVSEPWDYVTLADCREIVLNGKNWSSIFENVLVRDVEKNLPGDKNIKTDWIARINKIKNKLGSNSSYSVSSEDYQFVTQVYAWITDILVL